MNDYQEFRKKEINLIDLICYCLERWRWIVVSMVVMAILAGAYKYQTVMKANSLVQSEKNVMEDIEEEEQPSVRFYERAIEEMERDLGIQADYMERSVVMQLDPYHISTGTLSYYIEGGKHISSLIAAYSTFISSGRMAEELYATDADVPVEDLRYLITFSNSTSDVYKPNNNQVITIMEGTDDAQMTPVTGTESVVFQIQIRMPDHGLGEAYLDRAEEIMSEYMSKLQIEVEEHKLTLLSSVQSEMTDSDIQEYQSTMRLAYMTSVRNLQTLQTEFKAIQDTQGTGIVSNVSRNPVSSAIKFAILGLVLGGFLSCFVLLVFYLLGGRLQETEYFKEEFGMPLLGMVRIPTAKKKFFGFIDTWIFRLRGYSYAKINFEEQTKMAASNIQTEALKNSSEREVKKIMLSGTIAEKDISILCSQLASEMRDLSFSPYMQIVFQSAALKELENYDGVLFLEKRGISNTGLIEQEKKLALDRGVTVLGTIVVC